MLENPRSPRVRAVAKLTKRSARSETGLFLLEGPQAVREALAYRPEAIVELFATPSALERHVDLRAAAAAAGIEVAYATEVVLDAMADTVTPQG
ncbi:MAG: RNA methyltransferase, partial [Microbacterium sp.]|uniref:RNA methyltransferase substrate-binding domain-containing protein n=1 Tax=Microbacterium sp. TaxID=51671 RepID=UPI001AC7949A